MKPKITKQIAGKHVEVPVDDVWLTICKVVRLCRIAVAPGVSGDIQQTRLAFLEERLQDLDGLSFHNETGAV